MPPLQIADLGRFIDARNLAQDRQIATDKRNALLEAGGLAAEGDLSGARSAAFRGGLLDAGIGFEKLSNQRADRASTLKKRDIEAQQAGLERMAQQVLSVQNPEQYETLKNQFRQQGVNIPPQFEDFANREQAVRSLLSVKDQLQLNLDQKKFALEERKATDKSNGIGALTKGQEAQDKKFAEENVAFLTEESDMLKNLDQLETVAQALEDPEGPNISGPIIGATPDLALSVANPDAIDFKERVEEVVQRNLRLVLGAQFTQKEGERLIARAFNPRLSEKRNALRVRRLLNAMKQAYAQKKAASAYFNAVGTIKGFGGKSDFTAGDLALAIEGKGVLSDQQGSNGPIRVNSVEEARKLPSGTEFIDPQGNRRRVP